MSYIVRNQFGAFCSVCQSPLGLEEGDWDTCDACGGEGFGAEGEPEDYDPWDGCPADRTASRDAGKGGER